MPLSPLKENGIFLSVFSLMILDWHFGFHSVIQNEGGAEEG